MIAPPAWRLEAYDTLASTADLCRARAEAGEAEGLAILALRQSAGRGTRGRAWANAPGNLFLSVLLRPDAGAAGVGQWGLLAGVAVAEAVAGFLPPAAPLALKWPNDVLLGGGKLAGILVESATTPEGTLAWLSFGIGVNLARAPAVAGRTIACLADYAPPPVPPVAAQAVLTALSRWYAVVARKGFAPVRAAFLERAPAPGASLCLRQGARTVAGRFAGLDAQGALLLQTEDGLRAFAAGEVTSAAA